MELDALIKISGAIVALLMVGAAIFKASLNFLWESRKIEVAKLDFLQKLLNETKWKSTDNRILVEQAFSTIYGNLNYQEITVLMQSKTPDSAMRCYRKFYAVLDVDVEQSRVILTDRLYRPLGKRGPRVSRHILQGALVISVLFILGVAMYILSEILLAKGSFGGAIFTWIVTAGTIGMGLYTYWILLSYTSYWKVLKRQLGDLISPEELLKIE